jgi:Domain of unknown function (DUF4342)
MNTQVEERPVIQEVTTPQNITQQESTAQPENPVQENPVQENPVQENPVHEKSRGKRTWVEEVEVAGNQLVDRIKELVQESNTRRVIVRAEDNKEIFTVPLTAGVVVGGLITLTLPMLAALGAVAALVTKVKLEVIREEEPTSENKPVPEKK